MEPIHVPRPPKEAFNKDRRVSDLIRKQVEHFQHLEYKLPAEVRRTIPQQRVTTEGDAARYIAAMTGVLLAKAPAIPASGPPASGPAPITMPAPAPAPPDQGLSLAAGEQPSDTPAASRTAPQSKEDKS